MGPDRVQILAGPKGRSYVKTRVEARECLDGTVAAISQGQRLVLGPLFAVPSTRIPARDHRRVTPKGPQSIRDIRVRKRKEVGRAAKAKPSPATPGGTCW